MLWIILWMIFLVMSIVERRGVVFGFFAGMWILFLGIYVFIDGLELQSGLLVVSSGSSSVVSYSYSEVVAPFSSYGVLWAVPFILLGMYVMYLAVMKNKRGVFG